MRGSCDFRNIAQQRHILRRSVKLPGGDQRANRLATWRVVLGDVGVGVKPALDDFRRVFKVLAQILFREVQHFDFYILAEVSFIHQRLQAAPQ